MPNENNKPVYAMQYAEMIKYLKVLYQDLGVLHHNITGATFFSNHEQLGELYEEVGEMTDNLIELGMTIGLFEPSIEESLQFKASIPVRFYTTNEAFTIVVEEFKRAIELMEGVKIFVPDDIKNKIEEHEYTLRINGLYKAQMLLEY